MNLDDLRSVNRYAESTRSLSFLPMVHERQTQRMKTRSEWFLNSSDNDSDCPNTSDSGVCSTSTRATSANATSSCSKGLIRRTSSKEKRLVRRSSSKKDKENGNSVPNTPGHGPSSGSSGSGTPLRPLNVLDSQSN